METERQDLRKQLHARYKAARARMHCDTLGCKPIPPPSSPRVKPPSIAEIRRTVASSLGLTLEQLDSRSRQTPLLEARRAAMHLCVLFGHSRVKVGRAFAGRDHTSIIDALRKFGAMRDPALLQKLEALRITLSLTPAQTSNAAPPHATANTSAPLPNELAQKRRSKRVCVTTRYFPEPPPGLREKLAAMKDVRPHVRTDDSDGFDGW